MKSLFLPALLFFAVACGGNADSRSAKMPRGRSPELGVIESVFEVLNEKDRQRIGIVDKVSYDSGRIIYWVYGPDYREKRGYVLTNNRAFRYVWPVGSTKAVEEELVADTMNANVRGVLGHDKVIVLEPIDQVKLAEGLLGDRYAKPKPEKAEGDGEGDDEGDGGSGDE